MLARPDLSVPTVHCFSIPVDENGFVDWLIDAQPGEQGEAESGALRDRAYFVMGNAYVSLENPAEAKPDRRFHGTGAMSASVSHPRRCSSRRSIISTLPAKAELLM